MIRYFLFGEYQYQRSGVSFKESENNKLGANKLDLDLGIMFDLRLYLRSKVSSGKLKFPKWLNMEQDWHIH